MRLSQIKQLNKKRIPTKFTYFWFLRKLSIYPVYILQHLPFTPNQISLLAHVFTLTAAVLFIWGSFWYNVVALGFLHLAMFCDHIDGTLARVKNRLSTYIASYVDRIFHEVTMAFIFLGIGIGTTIFYDDVSFFFLGISAMVGLLINSYLFQLKNWILVRNTKKDVDEKQAYEVFVDSKFKTFFLDLFVIPMKYIRFILLCSVLLGVMNGFIIFYGLFLPFRAFVYFVFIYINFRRLDR